MNKQKLYIKQIATATKLQNFRTFKHFDIKRKKTTKETKTGQTGMKGKTDRRTDR